MSMVVFCQIPGAWRALNNQNDNPDDHSSFYNFMNDSTTVKVVLFFGSVAAGTGQALLWTAQGEYVSLCATEENKGFYFGYFWSWYMSS